MSANILKDNIKGMNTINLNDPKSQLAMESLGFTIEDITAKPYDIFSKGNTDDDIAKLRYEHHLRKVQNNITRLAEEIKTLNFDNKNKTTTGVFNKYKNFDKNKSTTIADSIISNVNERFKDDFKKYEMQISKQKAPLKSLLDAKKHQQSIERTRICKETKVVENRDKKLKDFGKSMDKVNEKRVQQNEKVKAAKSLEKKKMEENLNKWENFLSQYQEREKSLYEERVAKDKADRDRNKLKMQHVQTLKKELEKEQEERMQQRLDSIVDDMDRHSKKHDEILRDKMTRSAGGKKQLEDNRIRLFEFSKKKQEDLTKQAIEKVIKTQENLKKSEDERNNQINKKHDNQSKKEEERALIMKKNEIEFNKKIKKTLNKLNKQTNMCTSNMALPNSARFYGGEIDGLSKEKQLILEKEKLRLKEIDREATLQRKERMDTYRKQQLMEKLLQKKERVQTYELEKELVNRRRKEMNKELALEKEKQHKAFATIQKVDPNSPDFVFQQNLLNPENQSKFTNIMQDGQLSRNSKSVKNQIVTSKEQFNQDLINNPKLKAKVMISLSPEKKPQQQQDNN